MNGTAAPRVRGGPMPSALIQDRMTRVELTWIEKKIEYWIRFGQAANEQIIDRRQRILSFRPNTVFAFVRWAANDFGTIISRIDIVRAVEPGEVYQTLPFVRPGGEILLKIEGWPKVEDVLRRRTHLWLTPDRGRVAAVAATAAMAMRLGWDDARARAESQAWEAALWEEEQVLHAAAPAADT